MELLTDVGKGASMVLKRFNVREMAGMKCGREWGLNALDCARNMEEKWKQ